MNVRTYFSSKVNGFVYDYTGTPTHECFCGILWLCCVAEGVSVCTRLVHTRSIKGVPLLLHGVHVHVYVNVCMYCMCLLPRLTNACATICAGLISVIQLLSTNTHTTCLHMYMCTLHAGVNTTYNLFLHVRMHVPMYIQYTVRVRMKGNKFRERKNELCMF